jgi:hypothetical protein
MRILRVTFAGCARHIRKSDAHIACTCRARSAPASKTYGARIGGNWAIRVVIMVPILANHMGAIWGRWAPLHPFGPHMVFAPLPPKWRPSGRTGISGNHTCGPRTCDAWQGHTSCCPQLTKTHTILPTYGPHGLQTGQMKNCPYEKPTWAPYILLAGAQEGMLLLDTSVKYGTAGREMYVNLACMETIEACSSCDEANASRPQHVRPENRPKCNTESHARGYAYINRNHMATWPLGNRVCFGPMKGQPATSFPTWIISLTYGHMQQLERTAVSLIEVKL